MRTLYLISLPIEENATEHIPPVTTEVVRGLSCFITERTRTARRFIKKLLPDFDIDSSTFEELDKKNWEQNIRTTHRLMEQGEDIGLMSESGSPCVADPGGQIVDAARRNGYRIRPLSGPSSIILSLMASGLNGQQFSFHGYLPIKDAALKQKLQDIDRLVVKSGYTQIFIETPYRNQNMLDAILKYMSENVKICIARNVTSSDESINTKTTKEWKSAKIKLDKVPTIFLIGK